MDIRERQELKQKYNAIYFKHQSEVNKYESLRKWLKFSYTTSFLLANMILILFFAGLLFIVLSSPAKLSVFETFMFYVFIVACMTTFCIHLIRYFEKSWCKKKFPAKVKAVYQSDLLEVFDFIERGKEHDYSVLSSGLVMADTKMKMKIDDRFHGCYKDVSFHITELSNCLIRDIIGSYGGPYDCIVVDLSFNKFACSKIYVIPKLVCRHIIPILFGCFWGIFSFFAMMSAPGAIIVFIFSIIWTVGVMYAFVSSKFKKVNLESVDVDKIYYIEAENQVDARYILTPAFMKRLTNLKSVFNSKKQWCKIEGNRITMVFETNQDLFEIGNLNIPTTDPRQAEQFFNEVMAITDIIDHFKLYEKTGL